MQVQLFYDAPEDRLKLIVAEKAASRGWWITRRAARMLADALAARLSETVPPDTVGAARDWALAQHREEATRHIPITSTPILTVEYAHLLTAVRHGRHADGRHLLVLIGKNNEEQGLVCDDESLYAFLELFRQQLAQTDWDLLLRWPDARQEIGVAVAKIQ